LIFFNALCVRVRPDYARIKNTSFELSRIAHSVRIRVRSDYARFVIRDSSKLAFFIHTRLANNANGHIRRICTRRLILFVSIDINSLAIFLTKRTRITTNRA